MRHVNRLMISALFILLPSYIVAQACQTLPSKPMPKCFYDTPPEHSDKKHTVFQVEIVEIIEFSSSRDKKAGNYAIAMVKNVSTKNYIVVVASGDQCDGWVLRLGRSGYIVTSSNDLDLLRKYWNDFSVNVASEFVSKISAVKSKYNITDNIVFGTVCISQ